MGKGDSGISSGGVCNGIVRRRGLGLVPFLFFLPLIPISSFFFIAFLFLFRLI